MTHVVRNSAALLLLLPLIDALPAAAQTPPPAPVTVQATGSFAQGGSFTGTVTINRFEARGNEVVAVGFLRGVLQRGGRTIGTVVAGERVFPVSVTAGGIQAAVDRTEAPPARFTRTSGIARAQAGVCPIVQITLIPVDLDILGVQLTIDPIAIDLVGDRSGPLGALVCEVSRLLGNVAGLVGVLNNILALLILLLGGIPGGL